MPNWIYRIGGTGTTLSQDEQDNNILCIYDALNRYGWSKVAIAGACGCFQQESSYNPGIYETSHGGTLNNLPYFPGGMGLAQWTDYPAYTANIQTLCRGRQRRKTKIGMTVIFSVGFSPRRTIQSIRPWVTDRALVGAGKRLAVIRPFRSTTIFILTARLMTL